MYHKKYDALLGHTTGTLTDYPPTRIYVNKNENRITFKFKSGYYLELLTPKTIKLLGSTKNKITKDKHTENVPHLEITEVILIHKKKLCF